jgi:Uncharacterized protein conserved in bacteria
MSLAPFVPSESLDSVASYVRRECFAQSKKKYVLLFAYNGTGKTRLSMAFKDAGRDGDGRDTLYYNAFTEDLFQWNNDLENDTDRYLKLNTASHFFDGLEEMEMETRIREFLRRYADFDFHIDTGGWTVRFSRAVSSGNETLDAENIKVSRGEENIFIWCFFLAIAQLAIDGQERYAWVKYIYIDDPISSLDDNNAIAVASHLAQMLKDENNEIQTVISSHHTIFFNVLHNELKKACAFHLMHEGNLYTLQNTSDTPFFNHVALLRELKSVADSGRIYTYHFNILRNVLERTATFHGYKHFTDCIYIDGDDEDRHVHARVVELLNHGNYSLFEPMEMLPENKDYFRAVVNGCIARYAFNPEMFRSEP